MAEAISAGLPVSTELTGAAPAGLSPPREHAAIPIPATVVAQISATTTIFEWVVRSAL
ncbi:MAG: hypothetical protein ACXU9A_23920 [Xanthobacteraceae bacterium]